MLTIDSNYWVYYFNRAAKEHKFVIKTIEDSLDREDIVINTVIVMEIAHFLFKFLGTRKGKKKVDVFLSYPLKILEFDLETQRMAIELLGEYSNVGIGGRDATILAMMKKRGIKKIITHDSAIKKVDFVEVVDDIPEDLE